MLPRGVGFVMFHILVHMRPNEHSFTYHRIFNIVCQPWCAHSDIHALMFNNKALHWAWKPGYSSWVSSCLLMRRLQGGGSADTQTPATNGLSKGDHGALKPVTTDPTILRAFTRVLPKPHGLVHIRTGGGILRRVTPWSGQPQCQRHTHTHYVTDQRALSWSSGPHPTIQSIYFVHIYVVCRIYYWIAVCWWPVVSFS